MAKTNVFNFNYFGIDKSVLGDIYITSIDEEKLKKAVDSYDSSVIKLDYTKDKTLYSLDDRYIRSIYINMYGAKITTKCTSKENDTELIQSISKADIHINPIGFNIKPLSISEYQERLKQVFDNVKDIVGIEYNYSSAVFKKLEINKTFTIDSDFSKYKRCIDLLVNNIPTCRFSNTGELKVAQWECVKDKHKTFETLLLKSKRRQLKIYDKVKQLIDISRTDDQLKAVVNTIQHLNHKVMRVEYTLQDLGFVKDMTDKQIAKLFKDNFNADILHPYKEWREINKTTLISLVNSCKRVDRYWKVEFVRRCKAYEHNHRIPLLFDVEDLKEVLYITEGSTRKAQDKLSQIKTIIRKDKSYNLVGNSSKLNELLKKIQVFIG